MTLLGLCPEACGSGSSPAPLEGQQGSAAAAAGMSPLGMFSSIFGAPCL